MPLHRLFVPKGLYTPADKAALAQAITDIYFDLPPFYVVVLFIELEPTNFFVGGKTTQRMLRITVEHVARNFAEADDTSKRAFMDRYEIALAPFTKARGIDSEVQVVDCDVGRHCLLLVTLFLFLTNAIAVALEHQWNGAAAGKYRGGKDLEAGEQSRWAGGNNSFADQRTSLSDEQTLEYRTIEQFASFFPSAHLNLISFETGYQCQKIGPTVARQGRSSPSSKCALKINKCKA
ncbi:putative oxalocrotonate tautomerase enzyme-domain-containing protein [Mycena capillaripes]|nr:putative oxalocrotonate tautomerase enzyme-domain-containing protein [Mycena capillaripes]